MLLNRLAKLSRQPNRKCFDEDILQNNENFFVHFIRSQSSRFSQSMLNIILLSFSNVECHHVPGRSRRRRSVAFTATKKTRSCSSKTARRSGHKFAIFTSSPTSSRTGSSWLGARARKNGTFTSPVPASSSSWTPMLIGSK